MSVNSTMTETAQADGRVAVDERHVDDAGIEYLFSYLAETTTDRQAVLSARAEWLTQQLATRALVAQQMASYAFPLSPLEFLRRFTTAERIGVRAAALVNPIIGDFMDLLDRAGVVQRGDADLMMGLQYLVSQGLLTPERAVEIGGW